MSADITTYIDNITSEHIDKPKYTETVSVSVQPSADTKTVYLQAPSLYDLDIAVGEQLDVIGQWVGVSRNLNTPLTGVYFAFDTALVGFDEGMWQGSLDPASGLLTLPDEFYRLVIRARILNNSWNGTKEEIYRLADVLFAPSGYTYFVEDHGDLSITIGLLGSVPPTPILTALVNSGTLDIKPVTIRIANRVAQQGPVFSFDLDTVLFKGFDSSFWAHGI